MDELMWRIQTGDCAKLLRKVAVTSVDSFVTDPPYGIEFGGEAWDKPEVERANRGTLTNMRNPDGSQKFAKRAPAFDLSIEAKARMEVWHGRWAKEALRTLKPGGYLLAFGGTRTWHRLACAIEDVGFELRDSIAWIHAQGFPKSLAVDGGRGTNLKPAFEPIIVARKPLEGKVSENVARWGTGALNIDKTRIPVEGEKLGGGNNGLPVNAGDAWWRPWMEAEDQDERIAKEREQIAHAERLGRWPSNVVADPGTLGVEEVQRFFFCPKPTPAERDAGLGERSTHPTVKPVSLMRWLARLVTPEGGLVCDPFVGSGSTGIAAVLEGFEFLGIEQNDAYSELARKRLAWWDGRRGEVGDILRADAQVIDGQMELLDA